MVTQGNLQNASAAIIIYKKKFLMQLRSKDKKLLYPHHWGCFGGSKLSKETYIDCIIREVAEETNIDFKKKKFFFFLKIFFFVKYFNRKFTRNFFLLYLKDIKQFKKKFKLNEGADYGFFTYSQIIKLSKVVPYDKYAIDTYYKISNLNNFKIRKT